MIKHLEEVAGNILPGERIDVVAYGCTSGTVAIGDEKISSKIKKAKPNCYTTTPITASLKAFEKLNMKKIAVLTPYPKQVNETIFDYLINNNIEVESFSSFNLNYDSEIAQIKPENIIDQISEINLDDVDGLFVSCTAMKIVDVLDMAEQKFQTTIVSSNQAIIWDCLRLIKVNTSIKGFGKLLLN
jgi:maleate isomerase